MRGKDLSRERGERSQGEKGKDLREKKDLREERGRSKEKRPTIKGGKDKEKGEALRGEKALGGKGGKGSQ